MSEAIWHIQKSQITYKSRNQTLKNGPSKVSFSLRCGGTVLKVVITVIRAGLLYGKISQTTQTIHVVRATARTFELEQWEVLEKKLLAWKVGLVGVLDVVAAARKRGESQQGSSQALPT
jgi:eIF3 subunit M, C-terminal helix